MFEYTYNSENVLFEIKYKKSELKYRLKFLVFLNLIFVLGLAFLLAMHFEENASIYIAVIWSVIFPLADIALVINHINLLKFRLTFDKDGLCMVERSKKISIKYEELKLMVTMYRVGSSSLENLLDNHSGNVDNKNTICFLKDESIKLGKIKYKMRTSRGIEYGYYKDSCYLCDYRGSKLFEECKKVIEHYCPTDSVKMLYLDRDEI